MATSLSYREKSLYASLAAELFVYGPYFFLHQQNSVNKVAGMIIAIIVLQTILQSRSPSWRATVSPTSGTV